MISELRPRCSTVQDRSLPAIFSFLRIGQLGRVVLGVPAKTSIWPGGAPRIFKEGRGKFFKKGTLLRPNFWPLLLKIRVFTLFLDKNYQTFLSFANILSN